MGLFEKPSAEYTLVCYCHCSSLFHIANHFIMVVSMTNSSTLVKSLLSAQSYFLALHVFENGSREDMLLDLSQGRGEADQPVFS